MCEEDESSPRALRQARIALNAMPELSREEVCRLAARLPAWPEPAGGPAPSEEAPSDEDTGVPADAARVRPRAVGAARWALRHRRAVARRQERLAARHGYAVVTRGDPGYPEPLVDLELPPPVLFVRGDLPDAPGVAIVGSREAGAYGLEVAERFAAELAAAGLVVVSGLARGVDSAAHRGALAAPGGRTLAVLGCGPGRDYPRGSGGLAGRIAAGGGAVITEFPPGFAPLARNFPVRNRIIAALGVGTLVVRAAPRSGSLITARLALELGRDVYAVPGGIFDPRAAGTNALIQDGALLARSPRDVLESLPQRVLERLGTTAGPGPAAGERPTEGVEGEAARLLAALPADRPIGVEALARAAGLDVATALGRLVELEIAGRVLRLPGPAFRRRGEPWSS